MMLDLFTDVVAPEKQHLNYRRIKLARGPEQRVISRWSEGFPDRDGKFVIEFQSTFNSSFWELYLNAALRELGFALDYSHPAPDYSVTGPIQFTAEAAIGSNAEGYRPEWDAGEAGRLGTLNVAEILRVSSLRLANALSKKHRKYKDSYSQLSHVAGRPFVVCLAPFEQPYFFLQSNQAIGRVLYGYDEPIWFDDSDSGDRLVVGHSYRSAEVKDSGSTVTFGVFADDRAKEVSAVLFSSTATFGKVRALSDWDGRPLFFQWRRYNNRGRDPLMGVTPRSEYKESLLDGLHLYLNPFAVTPLDPTPFAATGVAIHWADPSTGTCDSEMPHGFLISRLCWSGVEKTHAEAIKRLKTTASYQEPVVPWKEGELVRAEGQVHVFVETHLMHYKGWTALVTLDSIDSDWGWLAVESLCHSVRLVVAANHSEQIKSILGTEFVATRDEARDAAKAAIDEAVEGDRKGVAQ